MKADLREVYGAATRAAAEAAIDAFADKKIRCQVGEGGACPTKDLETLLAFFDFPPEHWDHLRTSNPIESVLATMRQRTIRSNGCVSNRTALAMIFQLVEPHRKVGVASMATISCQN